MKIKFTLLFLAITLSLFSQKDIKLVDMPSIGLGLIPHKYCFEHEGNYYFQYLIISDKIQFGELQAQGTGIIAFNNELKEIKRYELKGNKTKEKILSTFFSNATTYVLTSHKEEKLLRIYLYSYDTNGNRISEKEVFKTDWENKIKIYNSADSSKIALTVETDPNNKKEACKIEACVIDQNGTILWNKAYDFALNSKEHDYKLVSVDNKGILYVFTDKKLEDKRRKYSLYILDGNATKTIDIQNREILGMLATYETKDGFYLTGWNQKIKEDEFRSPFLLKISPNDTSIDIPFDVIDPAFLKPLIDNEFYYEKYGWSNMMNLVHGWDNEKGEHKVAFQLKYVSHSQGGSITYKNFNFQNIYVFTFSQAWKLIDIKFCPIHVIKESSELTEPLYSLVFKDNLYMVYYEKENNINLSSLAKYKNKGDDIAVIRKFSADGSIQDIRLTKDLKKQYPFANVTAFTKNRDIIFFSGEYGAFAGKNYKMGKFNLDLFQK